MARLGGWIEPSPASIFIEPAGASAGQLLR